MRRNMGATTGTVSMVLDKGIITSEMFTAMLLMAVASTMLTVPVVAPMLRRMKG